MLACAFRARHVVLLGLYVNNNVTKENSLRCLGYDENATFKPTGSCNHALQPNTPKIQKLFKILHHIKSCNTGHIGQNFFWMSYRMLREAKTNYRIRRETTRQIY
jgi:hypothetical protein